ncbi:hypothetical protein HYW75_01555 [Candidatus Pacearchaeota archaeon]|nr:hypothetical protein [Candidatus Pacearchaeota archaeon]
MEKEDITLIAQLLTGIKDAIERLEEGVKKKDAEKVTSAKKEILYFQSQIDSLL